MSKLNNPQHSTEIPEGHLDLTVMEDDLTFVKSSMTILQFFSNRLYGHENADNNTYHVEIELTNPGEEFTVGVRPLTTESDSAYFTAEYGHREKIPGKGLLTITEYTPKISISGSFEFSFKRNDKNYVVNGDFSMRAAP